MVDSFLSYVRLWLNVIWRHLSFEIKLDMFDKLVAPSSPNLLEGDFVNSSVEWKHKIIKKSKTNNNNNNNNNNNKSK